MGGSSIGFIIQRYVCRPNMDKYWKVAYTSIRKYYPDNYIVIIDDDSDYSLIDIEFEKELTNTIIVKSQFPRRGELLPYVYFLNGKYFDTAVIINDSVFLNSTVDFSLKPEENYKMLWQFEHNWDEKVNEKKILNELDDKEELLKLYNQPNLWKGCFGSMTVIKHSFLKKIHERHNLYKLIPIITSRPDRCCLERVIACILQLNSRNNCIFGDIHAYCKWGVPWEDKWILEHLPMIKVWTGR
jgi:hypothetical protein